MPRILSPPWISDLLLNLGMSHKSHLFEIGVATASNEYSDWAQANPSPAAFIEYASLGLLDPKLPAELKLFGPLYVGANILGVGTLGWIFDPLHKRPGGVDDWWADADWNQIDWGAGPAWNV